MERRAPIICRSVKPPAYDRYGPRPHRPGAVTPAGPCAQYLPMTESHKKQILLDSVNRRNFHLARTRLIPSFGGGGSWDGKGIFQDGIPVRVNGACFWMAHCGRGCPAPPRFAVKREFGDRWGDRARPNEGSPRPRAKQGPALAKAPAR